MSALDVLRQIKQARRAQGTAKIIEWGNADYINNIGVENLSRRELRNHLEARDLETKGTRLELLERLRTSIADEQLNKFAYVETIDTEFLIEADKEERGSVYVVGNNSKGQLGVGDFEPRFSFVVIPQLRGLGVNNIYAGQDMCYAVTEDHDVYVWGGGGVGRTGIGPPVEKKEKKGATAPKLQNWLEPQLVKDLVGEEILSAVVGSSHCMAMGAGGDCFVWGDGDAGQLGLGDFKSHPRIAINNSFSALAQISAGCNHSAVLTKTGQVFAWGHGGNGRLGIGETERVGVPERERCFYPVPQRITTLETIKQVSCGADHVLAYGTSGVWSWGNGAGGKLGLGDNNDRYDPCLVQKLRGKFVLQVAAGTWHSAALVAHPPMLGGGWVYTWGSGYYGQLAQGTTVVALLPEVVEYFLQVHMLVKMISVGSHHMAAVTVEGELYSWGSNRDYALGRKIDERHVNYTAIPGHCGGFGAIVGRIGRGFPRHVACGREFTVVVTYPYTGPDLKIATRLMEEARVREQESLLRQRAVEDFSNEK